MSGGIKTGNENLKSKYTLLQIADNMVKKGIAKINKSDDDISLDYRTKPESQTRYWRKCDAYTTFFLNKHRIYAIFQEKDPHDKDWIAFRDNKYAAEWVLVSMIKVLQVKYTFIVFNIQFFVTYIYIYTYIQT